MADFQGEASGGAAAPAEEGRPPPLVATPPGSPAAVLPRGVQRRLGPAEAQAGEGVVQGQRHVTQAVDAVGLIVDVLPVGAEARRARGVVPIQVIVQLPDDFLIHHSFKLAGEEGGPGCLLRSWDKGAESASGMGEVGREEASSAVPAWIHLTLQPPTTLSVLSFLICQQGFRTERVNICKALKAMRDPEVSFI